MRAGYHPVRRIINVLATIAFTSILAPQLVGAAAPTLTATDESGRITVSTLGFPETGWRLVFDDERNGSISEFRLADVEDGANLACEGSPGAHSGLFEKMWETSRGPRWLSGEWGNMDGGSILVETTCVRARVVQMVSANDALPGETPSRMLVTYTIYHSGRMYIETEWEINEVPVRETSDYTDNSWRLTLASRDLMMGADDDSLLVALTDDGRENLPQVIFGAFPTFWQSGTPLSFLDTPTRDTYLNPLDPMNRFYHPFAGMAGARMSGNASPGHPYLVGETFRHVFVLDWSRPGPGTLQDAREISADFGNPDPLDGSPGAGEVLVGTLLRGAAGDMDGDGFIESEGCYTLSAFAGMAECRLASTRGGMTDVVFRHPVLKISNFDVLHDFLMVLISQDGGVSWEMLTQDSDFVATTYAEESQIGANTRVVSILQDLPINPHGGSIIWFMEDTERIITATMLSGPQVVALPTGVRVSWQSRIEDQYTGYHVSRREADSDEWVRLTTEAIPDDTPVGGKTYEWVDRRSYLGTDYIYRVEALPVGGGEPFIITAGEPVTSKGPLLVRAAPVLKAVPNPFNPRVTLIFEAPASGDEALLEVMDIRGRVVRRLLSGPVTEGSQCVVWDGLDDEGAPVTSGVFVARLSMGSKSTTTKIVMRK